jgi:hypothetical protein
MKKINLLVALCLLLSFIACNNKTKKTDSKNDNSFPSELVKFIQYEGNPVFSGTGIDTWDKNIRERGDILFEDSIYKMWYSGYNEKLSKKTMLGYATSKDGINWEKYSNQPIFSDKWVEDMDVIKNNGTYYMFAEGDEDIAHLLVSQDGINWQEKGDLVILTTKGDTIPGPYGTPAVYVEKGEWNLFYEREDSAIWLATSTDQITWKNVQDDPVITTGTQQYDDGAIAADQVIKYKGKYFLYYHSIDKNGWIGITPSLGWSSSVAMSSDLVHWKKYSGNPIVGEKCSSPILVFPGGKPVLYTVHANVCRYTAK